MATVELSDVADATIISIWRHIYSFLPAKDILSGMLVCRSFAKELPSLVEKLRVSIKQGQRFGQQQLEHVAKTYPNVKELSLSQGYDDHSPSLDFSKVKLLELESLFTHCVPLTTFTFTRANTPKLQHIMVDHGGNFREFNLDLPDLESISFEHTQVQDSSNFGPSLSRCPKFQRLSAYKLWGLSSTIHKLHLPEATSLDFHRSDDLEGLELWAPKLSHLGLRGCYGIEHIRLMDDPAGTEPKALTVNLINANIDRVSKRHLKQHPRVKAGAVWTRELQEWGGLAAELGLVDDYGLDDEPSDDDMDSDELEGEGPSDDDMDSDELEGYEGMGGMMAQLHAVEGMFGGAVPHELMQLMMMAGGMGAFPGMGPPFMAEGDDDEYESDEGSWETDDGDAEEEREADGAAAGADAERSAAAGSGSSRQAGGAGGPSCVVEEVEW